MIKNYLLITFRNMARQRSYAFINLFGLAVGIAACIMIMLYVQNELSYDKYLENHKQIYRVSRSWLNDNGETNLHLGHLAPPFSPLLKMDYEGTILQSIRLMNYDPLMTIDEKQFEEDGFFFSDPEVFKVFSWKILKGDASKALTEPNSLVLCVSTAKRYFGDEDPIGKIVNFNNTVDLQVTAIMEDLPDNSHMHPTMLAPMILVEAYYGGHEQFMGAWGSNNFSTFLLMKEGTDIKKFETGLGEFFDKHMASNSDRKTSDFNKLHLMNITDIHLKSHLDSEIEANGDIAYIYLFSIIAVFILVLACINFVNLATARSAKRSREVGMRKVLGAYRNKLIVQFLTESTLYALFSLLIAIVIVSLLLPWFNNFSQRELAFDLLNNNFLVLLLIGITGVTGLLAGAYPAFFLSSFQPATILKGANIKSGNGRFRSVLVVFQFFISIVMLIGVGVVNDQLDYVKSKSLGFGDDGILILPTSDEITSKYDNIKAQLNRQQGIESVAYSSRIPSGRLLDSQGGSVEVDGEMVQLGFRLADVHTDFDFLSTMQIPIIAGRDFNEKLASDSTESFIINEAAVKAAGWKRNDEAVGKKISYGGRNGFIIGIVKDFHFESLKQEIAPIIFMITGGRGGSVVIKLRDGMEEETLAYLQEQWSYLRPGYPFTYFYVGARFDSLYEDDERVGDLVSYFSLVAVIIGILGLFGLASFTIEQRFKEIGVRKAMGASSIQILLLLNRNFTLLVLAGFILAIPVAFWSMNKWLDSFAYHDSISVFSIIGAGTVAIIIAWLTVSMQTLKAARTNPVDSLRYE